MPSVRIPVLPPAWGDVLDQVQQSLTHALEHADRRLQTLEAALAAPTLPPHQTLHARIASNWMCVWRVRPDRSRRPTAPWQRWRKRCGCGCRPVPRPISNSACLSAKAQFNDYFRKPSR